MGKPSKTEDLICRFCGSKRVRQSHRRALLERLFLPVLRRRPFRCMDCYQRFYNAAGAGQLRPPVAADPPKSKPLQGQPTVETKTPVSSSQVERRNFTRLPCQIPARVVTGSGPSIVGVLSDISLNGCFIRTPDTVPVGNEIEIYFEVVEGPQSRALVRRSLPAIGMGMEFTSMTTPNFRKLQNIARNSVRLQLRP
jgi:hypothetical protein